MTLDLMDAQTEILLETVDALSEDDLASASSLPGWSRGHVLAHLAGNAEGLGRRARSMIDEIPRAMYESPEARSGDIEWRSGRSIAQHRLALSATHDDARRDFAGLPQARRDEVVEIRGGLTVRMGDFPLLRVQEVCIHHSDLGMDCYTWEDWPDELGAWALPRAVGTFASRGDFPVAWVEADGKRMPITGGEGPGLAGSSQELLAWITGRAPGKGLAPVGLAAVPAPPPWL